MHADTIAPQAPAVEALSRAFGTRLLTWSKAGQQWRCLEEADRHACPTLAPWLDEAAEAAAGKPVVRRVRGNLLFVGVSLGARPGGPHVAAGIVPADPQGFAQQLAEASLAAAQVQSHESGRQVLLESYADKLADSFEELTFLRKLSRHVEHCDATRGLADVAHTILPSLCELMAVEGLALYATTGDPRATRRIEGVVDSVGDLAAEAACWSETIEALAGGPQDVVVCNVARSETADLVPPAPEGVRAYVAASLKKDGVVYGWLLGVNKRPPKTGLSTPSNSLGHDEIGSMEASLLHAAAVMLATHAANARLFREKEELIDEAIHTLVGVIEAKDAYTCGHSDRVALVGRRLAEELGLSPKECHEVYLSGLLHDIGKVGVSDDVLLKPGALEPEEFAQIKRHPECGWRLLQRLKPLGNLLPGVLHHHEATDGSGYPHGLSGDAIPLVARILAVADGWDAMTSDRPYRAGMPLEKAEGILRNGSGSQWDSQIVDAFFAAREDVHQITATWRDHLERILALPWAADRIEKPTAAAAIAPTPTPTPEAFAEASAHLGSL
ncbi:Cyclic di-GMP phosphodiesterase response regulator RpfG [Pirellulimonas nuda]|uniref:Cyclic di-GMP phosphodiesterase response regulator RpfG n=1 Tax=Pirellulimonas nuda TaxID=2528009 RepID=A0A518DFY2_9BACT|nr:HD-GYP domain-containing protein [Pirellulimonas nuda]QDU90387.1 Cyclic di-GMP phosphodiesterase response regulator RpfG [Pirellulimonas nuda]